MSDFGKSKVSRWLKSKKHGDCATGSYTKLLKEKRLRTAVITNNTDKIKELIDSGVDVNASDESQRTPLHLAASRGYAPIVELLLKHGADPQARDTIGNTPLHLASCTNNLDIVLALLAAGADAESQDSRGCTALQLSQGRLRLLVRCLKGAEPKETTTLTLQVQKIVDYLILSLDKKQSDKIKALHDSLATSSPEDHINALLNELSNLNI